MSEKQYPRRIPFIFLSSSLLANRLFASSTDFSPSRRYDLTDRDDIVESEIPKFNANEILDKTAAKLIPDHD